MTKKNLEATARAGSVAHMIRGGRLVKRKGQVLSFAPHVGQLCSVSCGALAAGLALGVSLLGAAPASAGTCDPLAPPFDLNGAAVTCSGPADQANDVTQEIVGQQLTVTTTPGFGIFTSTGDGLSLTVGSGYSSGLTFVDTNTIASQITAAETAIDAYGVGTSSITTNATIKGGAYGIKFAVGSGGSLTIDATGSVEGTTYDGINADISGEARDMTVRAATVTGGQNGIDVVNNAYGNTFVGSSNSVTAINGIGIIVSNNSGTENLTVDVVNVSGKAGGIEVGNNGKGATSVTSSGEVYSSNGDGISAYNDASATDITIDANDVDAKNTGILARNLGSGNTTIDSRTYVKAGGDGISATNEIDAGDLTITAVKVESGDDGIVASNFGKGATSVTATGDIVGAFSGINVANAVNTVTYTSNTTDLTVKAANVTGGEFGIIASNQGNGETYIKSTGKVSANSATGTGISVTSGEFTTGLTIRANDVKGGKDGIDASHNGDGNLSITTDGFVEALDGFGIDAYSGSAGSDLTILANGDVSALLDGISVYNNGIGSTSVTAFGTVEAGNVGISALNGLDALDLEISANVVTASGDFGIGIFAYNTGKGSTSVTATGAITANGDYDNGIYGDSGRGIYVFNSSTAENLEIIALDTVTGGDTGISAKNNGSGSTSITASGLVTGSGINSGGGAGTGASGDGIYAYNATSAGALTVSAIDVVADKNGISVFNKGTGATTVSATGVVTGGVHGIYAKSDGTATSLTINANIVNGGEDGIVASNTGRGATFVSASGAVSGTTGFGIYARNITSGTDLTIDVETDVTGGTSGIFAVNNGSGVTLINTTGPNLLGGGTVTGDAGNGIDVLNEVGASDLIIEAASVTGSEYGIKAVNKSDNGGSTSITATGDVKGTAADGIFAENAATANGLSITANNVTGGDDGIYAFNFGAGVTSVTATGTVSGGDNGIDVTNIQFGTGLTVVANTVTGGNNGIDVANNAKGTTSITATGLVTGTAGNGIDVYNATTTDSLSISASNVTGNDDGILVSNNGTGSTSVIATGAVTGSNGYGIDASNGTTALNLTIAANVVTGGQTGIYALNDGTGSTTVTASGLVTGGVGGNGIEVHNAASATALTVSAAAVTGGLNGIFAENLGTGATLVSASGDVTGGTADGIFAENAATANGLSITANNVTGGDDGIYAFNFGAGVTSVTATGTVSGGDNGIDVTNIQFGTGLTVVANTVTGGNNGIDVANNAKGSTSITATGLVTGTAGNGIDVYNATTTDSLSISANNVTGNDDGILVSNNGTGSTSVIATGAVTGSNGYGIDASNGTTALNLTIAANVVTGGQTGIYALNDGTGSTTVTASGLVTGGVGGNGIEVHNAASATALTVSAAAVTGGVNGIFAENLGTGATLVSATGLVGGTAVDGFTTADGIHVANSAIGNSLIPAGQTATPLIGMQVSAHDVNGGANGIFADHNGAGGLVITAGGAVNGRSADGINANNSTLGTHLSITTATVSGGNNGVFAVNNGTGATLVSASGAVTGGTADGIHATSAGTNLTISAAAVTGGLNGIFADNAGDGFASITANGAVIGGLNGILAVNRGAGATSVSAIGPVTGTAIDGINIRNSGAGLTVLVNDVTGGDDGIDVFNSGLGATTITSTGDIAAGDNGIEVINGPAGTNLTVITKDVTAGDDGINAFNLGSGSTVISSTGAVTGGKQGVFAFNAVSADDLTVNVVDVNGETYGISVANLGRGITSVTSTGTVEGTGASGIYVYNGSEASGLTVSANNVTSGVDGIYVVHNGTGDTVVTASGAVDGATGVGILATALNAGGGAVRITANSASGLLGGIVVQNEGAGASTVSVSGTIAGGDGVGIETSTLAGNLTTLHLAGTAVVGATSGKAIANNEGNSILNVSANAVINGTVELDGGTDTANFARNGSLATISLLDGGDNVASADGSVDTLNLNGVDDFNLVGANTVNWEVININGGTIGFSDARILAETINVNNRATLNGANSLVATANVNIAEGAALIAGNAGGTAVTRITGNLVNAGVLNLSGSTAFGRAGDTLSVAGNYTGVAAQVRLDTVLNGDNSPTDLLNVAGNVTGSSRLTVNNAGGAGGLTTGDGIRIVQVGGASAQDGFVLLDELEAGAFRYDLFLGGVTDPGDQDWYLRTVGLSDVAATTLSFARLSDDIAMTFLGTLHERVGEQEHLAKRGYQSGGVSGIWGRFIGKGFRDKLTSPTLGDVKSTGSITGLQMGLDFVRNVKGDGSATFAGAYSGYADGSSSDRNIFQGVSRRSGTSDSKGWLAGLYGTHYSSAGWYANVVLQANWVDASANGRNGNVLKTDGRTYLSSFELGQSLKLADRLAFEPQVQLIFGDTQFDAATDSNGIESRVGIESSLLGRVGFRLKTTKSEKYNAEGGLFSGYLKANLWHNLSGSDIELFSAGQAVGGFEPKKTWVDVGLGTTLTVAKNTEIYFDADVEFGLDKKNTAGRGNVGLRFNW